MPGGGGGIAMPPMPGGGGGTRPPIAAGVSRRPRAEQRVRTHGFRSFDGLREQSFRLRTVTFTLAVLLVRVLHVDLFVAQKLSIHRLDGGVRRLERVERHEAESLAHAGVGIAHDLRRVDDDPEGAEGVVQQLFIDVWIQGAPMNVGANFEPRLSPADLFTLMGLPNIFTMFKILIACVSSDRAIRRQSASTGSSLSPLFCASPSARAAATQPKKFNHNIVNLTSRSSSEARIFLSSSSSLARFRSLAFTSRHIASTYVFRVLFAPELEGIRETLVRCVSPYPSARTRSSPVPPAKTTPTTTLP